MTAAEVRAKYPRPSAIADANFGSGYSTSYCVTGAACIFAGFPFAHFPSAETAASNLGIDYFITKRIQAANDHYDFELAWRLLDEALKGTK